MAYLAVWIRNGPGPHNSNPPDDTIWIRWVTPDAEWTCRAAWVQSYRPHWKTDWYKQT